MTLLLGVATGVLMLATVYASGRDWRLIILSSFRLHLVGIAAALGALVLIAGLDAIAGTGLLLVLLGVAGINLHPILKGVRQSRQAVDGPRLRIAFANLLESNVAHQHVIEWVREEKPDIFIVAETAAPWRLSLAALSDQFPHSSPSKRGDVVLFSRLPFESEPVDLYPAIGHAVLVGIAGATVVGLHTASPQTPQFVRALDALLETLAGRLRDTTGPAIAIGDFNAAPWTRAVLGFRDATGLACGPGAWIGTFPAEVAGRKFPTWLAIPIDIAMAGRGARVVARRHGPRIGSDHWPILVDVALEKRPEKPANPAP